MAKIIVLSHIPLKSEERHNRFYQDHSVSNDARCRPLAHHINRQDL